VTCELLLYLVLAKYVLLLENAPHINPSLYSIVTTTRPHPREDAP
jgi:hypothetical protein